jgi:hypothetical protein
MRTAKGIIPQLYACAYCNTTPPEFTLLGDIRYSDRGSVFSDPGATANDVCEGDLTANFNVVVLLTLLRWYLYLELSVPASSGNGLLL